MLSCLLQHGLERGEVAGSCPRGAVFPQFIPHLEMNGSEDVTDVFLQERDGEGEKEEV